MMNNAAERLVSEIEQIGADPNLTAALRTRALELVIYRADSLNIELRLSIRVFILLLWNSQRHRQGFSPLVRCWLNRACRDALVREFGPHIESFQWIDKAFDYLSDKVCAVEGAIRSQLEVKNILEAEITQGIAPQESNLGVGESAPHEIVIWRSNNPISEKLGLDPSLHLEATLIRFDRGTREKVSDTLEAVWMKVKAHAIKDIFICDFTKNVENHGALKKILYLHEGRSPEVVESSKNARNYVYSFLEAVGLISHEQTDCRSGVEFDLTRMNQNRDFVRRQRDTGKLTNEIRTWQKSRGANIFEFGKVSDGRPKKDVLKSRIDGSFLIFGTPMESYKRNILAEFLDDIRVKSKNQR